MKNSALCLIALALLTAACTKKTEQPAVEKTVVAPAAPAPSQPAADAGKSDLDLITKAILKFKLTTLKPECLTYVEAEKVPGALLVRAEVREKHDATCGGDPNVAPRLFEVRVNKETGETWADVDAGGIPIPGGDYRSLGKVEI